MQSLGMFEVLTAICLVTDITGAPVNSCYLQNRGTAYTDFNECVAMANIIEQDRRRSLIAELGDQTAIVVMSVCIKVGGDNV